MQSSEHFHVNSFLPEHSLLLFLKKSFYFVFRYSQLGEGNGTPLQYSCLANPMDGGAL